MLSEKLIDVLTWYFKIVKEKIGKNPDISMFSNFPQMLSFVCSADCGPGFRKFRQEGMAACCFDCSPCPENEVSNETSEYLLMR